MQTITLVSQKGGSGKSTLLINLAVTACQNKKRVLIIDLDPQQTSEAWYQERLGDDIALVTADSNELSKAIAYARDANFHYAFIDTAGRDAPSTAAAVRMSDYCLIPCRPTPADLKALPPTIATIERLQIPYGFVLNQTPAKGSRVHEALAGLSQLHANIAPPIVSRVVYQDAQGAGQGVTEFASNSLAAFEMRELWKWLKRQLGKLSHG